MEPETFASRWAAILTAHPNRAAIYADTTAVLRSFADIEQERAEWGARLAHLPRGASVVAQLGNSPSWPALFLATLDRSLVLSPIEPDFPEAQLQGLLAAIGAQVQITEHGTVPHGFPVVAWGVHQPDLLKVTSGTTGTPRCVRFRQTQLLADGHNICRTKGITAQDRNFGVISFSHSYGFSNLLVPLLCQGTALVCSRERFPRALYQNLQKSGATIFPGTPALFQALAALGGDSLNQVRLCISAGAPLAGGTARLFYDRFSQRLHSFYGSSECGGIAYDREGRIDPPTGFVGAPLEGLQVRRIQNDRVEISGPNVGDGYFPAADPTVLGDGRFIPGDLVRWQGDEMQIYGRASDFINVAGRKVHPSVVEEHLRLLPGVIDAIVFGVPSRTRNEDLVAYVLAPPERVSRRILENHCRSGLGDWQIPRDFRILPAFPVNSRGKMSRAELSRLHRVQTGSEQ